MSLNQNNEILDVVIIGGGLVGGLTALLLAQGGVQPTVLDAAPILDADKTLDVAKALNGIYAQAPIRMHQVIMANVAGTGADIIATRTIDVK